ncbi:MAG: hypothetical protein ACPGYL_07495, partial [Rhodospirillaceae bacterium]
IQDATKDGGKALQHTQTKKAADDNQTTFQDIYGACVVVKSKSFNVGVAIEIPQTSHFGPGRVDPQGRQGQQGVYDPDAEILFPGAGEPDGDCSQLSLPVSRRIIQSAFGPMLHVLAWTLGHWRLGHMERHWRASFAVAVTDGPKEVGSIAIQNREILFGYSR